MDLGSRPGSLSAFLDASAGGLPMGGLPMGAVPMGGGMAFAAEAMTPSHPGAHAPFGGGPQATFAGGAAQPFGGGVPVFGVSAVPEAPLHGGNAFGGGGAPNNQHLNIR